jgi:dihydropyrimidine dehydrogenase (NADP+)/dihydropyrimidine dehydrogenase (NAD+) subunit PreA
MPTLETTVNGLKLPNPFVIGSGPPGTNGNVIGKAFDEGWGAVICKTISLDASKVVNVQPRYGRLRARDSNEIIGWEKHRVDQRSELRHLGRGTQSGVVQPQYSVFRE